MLRPGKRLLCSLALLALAFPSLGTRARGESFPVPASLAPRVEFWTRVYTEVGTHGGLIHDLDDLGIVYEVVSLPEGSSSRAVEREAKRAKERVQAALRKLAAGHRSGLNETERRILALFPEGVSSSRLRAAAGRVRFQLGQADKFREGIRRMGRWEGYIRQTLRERGVPEDLVALPHVESSYNPKAHSHAGASGLWQFTRGTGRLFMRVDSVVDERRDPWSSSVAAARLLKSNHEELRTWPLAITAYNHGVAGMKRAVRQLGTRDIGRVVERYRSRSFGFASSNFYAEFLAARNIDADPARYFGPIRKDPPENPEIVVLDHYYKASSLSHWLEIPITTLRDQNPALLRPVWSGQKYAPRGYGVRLPRRPDKPVGKVMLARATASERFSEQTVDRRYRVRPGDTLSRIARRYHASESELVALNNLRSRHFLRAGQWLEIPSKEPPPAARVAGASPAAPEPIPADGLYRVRKGDSLGAIAARFGVGLGDLQAKNRIRDPHRIAVGQVLEIPGGARSAAPGEAGVYTVAKGDTVHSIARRFGTTEQAIVDLNGIQSRHLIRVGQVLHVPGAPESAAPAAAAPPTPPAATGVEIAAEAAVEEEVEAEVAATEASAAGQAADADVRPAPTAAAQPEPPTRPAAEAPAQPGPGALAEAEAAPGPAPPTVSLPLAPERYVVDAQGGIRVQPDETLGHYAEWLETSARSLRGRNGLRPGTPLVLGMRLELDFSRVPPDEFERRRLSHHREVQSRFFASYEVDGTREHVVRRGETLWQLSRGPDPIPVWLLHRYNPDLDLAALRAGQTVLIPRLRPRG